MTRLTKEQAAIIGAYTGILCGPFQVVQEYAERKLGRPLFTHEFGDKATMAEIKAAAREDFLALCADGEG
jgi:hypothetical protein